MARLWNRQELLVAMNLYTRLPFGQFHGRNPQIIALAERLNRTPDALAMKLCNLASLDPAHAARGVVGLRGVSELDRAVWAEFQADWEALGLESELAFREVAAPAATEDRADEVWSVREGPTETERVVRQRLGQSFFRRTVLVSYGRRCCITGNPIPALLSASHIVPWAVSPRDRLNPRNGLCLAKTQDAAFDQHLLTLDEDLRVVLSATIRDRFDSDTVRLNFQPYEGQRIRLPERFEPDAGLLQRHRDEFARLN